MINYFPQAIPIIVNSFEGHSNVKQKILDGIDSMGIHGLVDEQEQLSNTDWNLSRSSNRPYAEHLDNIFAETFKTIIDAFDYGLNPITQSLKVSGYWFQQYENGDFHKWHTHPGDMFSNVYYVELPDGASKTSFMLNGNEFTVDVKEGDILTFPAFLLHQSKPNQSSRKTVVAFNI